MKNLRDFFTKVYKAASLEFWNAPISTTSIFVGLSYNTFYLFNDSNKKAIQLKLTGESLIKTNALLKSLNDLNDTLDHLPTRISIVNKDFNIENGKKTDVAILKSLISQGDLNSNIKTLDLIGEPTVLEDEG